MSALGLHEYDVDVGVGPDALIPVDVVSAVIGRV